MKTLQLDHVALHVQDVEKSCRFYREVLQLAPLPRPAFDFPGAWFRIGERQELHLIGGRTQPVVSESRGSHFAMMIDDIDAWERHFQSIGFNYRPRKTRPDGAYQVFLQDPDGHMIEINTPPGIAK